MGMMGDLFGMFFGGGRNVIVETAEVFRANAEADEDRAATQKAAAMRQFGAEFRNARVARFDRFIDGLNRLPRPLMAFGVLGLMVAAMADPVWFSQRMVGIAVVPEPMWWLMGAIVSFYFGARHQAHGQAFQESIAATMARVPQVVDDIGSLEKMRLDAISPRVADAGSDARVTVQASAPTANAALFEWRHTKM